MPRRKMPAAYASGRLDLGGSIRMSTSPVVAAAAFLLIAVVVIAEDWIDRKMRRSEVLRDLRPLRIGKTLDAARIEVVANEKNAVDMHSPPHRNHPCPEHRVRRASVAGDDESERCVMRQIDRRNGCEGKPEEKDQREESRHLPTL